MREAFSTSGLFVGWPCNVIPFHNIQALANNDFYLIGKIISTSIIQGGQPPVCFAAPVADFLVYNEIRCSPSLEDIPDVDLREKLRKVLTIILFAICMHTYRTVL